MWSAVLIHIQLRRNLLTNAIARSWCVRDAYAFPVKNRSCQVERERGISEHSTGHDLPIRNIECLDLLSCDIEGKRGKFDVTISLDYSSISQDASSANRPKIVTDRARTWVIGAINTARFPNTKHRMLRSIFRWDAFPTSSTF